MGQPAHGAACSTSSDRQARQTHPPDRAFSQSPRPPSAVPPDTRPPDQTPTGCRRSRGHRSVPAAPARPSEPAHRAPGRSNAGPRSVHESSPRCSQQLPHPSARAPRRRGSRCPHGETTGCPPSASTAAVFICVGRPRCAQITRTPTSRAECHARIGTAPIDHDDLGRGRPGPQMQKEWDEMSGLIQHRHDHGQPIACRRPHTHHQRYPPASSPNFAPSVASESSSSSPAPFSEGRELRGALHLAQVHLVGFHRVDVARRPARRVLQRLRRDDDVAGDQLLATR